MDCTHRAPLSTGFPRQEYWKGLPFPPPGNQIRISYIVRWIVYHYTTWEALYSSLQTYGIFSISLVTEVYKMKKVPLYLISNCVFCMWSTEETDSCLVVLSNCAREKLKLVEAGDKSK